MIRAVILVLILVVLFRWATGQWPWAFLSTKSTRSQAIFKARKLLGVSAGATQEDIRAAHKRLVALAHPDRGGSNAQVHELNAARDLLLDELPHETP